MYILSSYKKNSIRMLPVSFITLPGNIFRKKARNGTRTRVIGLENRDNNRYTIRA